MPIKNYTTNIAFDRTIAEIHKLLAKAGAGTISTDFENGEAIAVRFTITFQKQEMLFRLPCNPDGVAATLKRDRSRMWKDTKKVRNISWRIIKDWVDAQLAIIDAGQAKPTEVFFPYILEKSGETLFQKFENNQKRLTD